MRPAILCVALTACLGPNPAFDEAASLGPSSGPAPQTTSSTSPPTTTHVEPTTSSEPATGDPSSVPGDTSSSATTDPATTTTSTTAVTTATTTDTTSPADCAPMGGQCQPDKCCGECATCGPGGVCELDDAKCGPCGTCTGDGTCQKATPGTACPPADDSCEKKVYGLELAEGACYAQASAGTCDDQANCVTFCVKGMKLLECDPRCILADNPCSAGLDINLVDIESMCHNEGAPAGGCTNECVNNIAAITRACDMNGACKQSQITPCEPYTCNFGSMQCNTTCAGMQDCAMGHPCENNVCQM